MEKSKETWIISLINLVIVVVLAIPIAILRFCVDPVKRGFFCNDEDLSHPFRESTVSNTILIVFGVGLPIVVILLTEWFIPTSTNPQTNRGKLRTSSLIIVDHLFGVAVTVILTDIAKYTIGRLR